MRRYGFLLIIAIVLLFGAATAVFDITHNDVIASADVNDVLRRMDRKLGAMEMRLESVERELKKQEEVNVKLTLNVAELQHQLLSRKQKVICNRCMKTSPSSSQSETAYLKNFVPQPKQFIKSKQPIGKNSGRSRMIQKLIQVWKKQQERIVALETACLQTRMQGREQGDRQSVANDRANFNEKGASRPGRALGASIAFTAYLENGQNNLGLNQVLQMRGIVLNEGNGYSQHTGIFTSPLSGVYLFSYTIDDYHPQQLRVNLLVDGLLKVSAVTNPPSINVPHQGGNQAILRLNAGQSVWLAVAQSGDNIYGDINRRYSTFSGVFLYA